MPLDLAVLDYQPLERADSRASARQWLNHVGLSAPVEQLEGDAEIS